MFEFMYAKKIKKDIVMEIIDKCKDDYYMSISHKPNGNTEIFIGRKKNESADKAESEDTSNLCNKCANERCIMQSGICRKNCEFFIAKESEDKE